MSQYKMVKFLMATTYELREDLETIVDAEGLQSRSDLIRIILKQWIDDYKLRKLMRNNFVMASLGYRLPEVKL